MAMRKRREALAVQYSISKRTVDRVTHWIKDHPDRYPKDAIEYHGRMPFIRDDVFYDALVNADAVDCGLLKQRWTG